MKGELLRYASVEMGQAFHPLHCKVQMAGRAPSCFKGGINHPLEKRSQAFCTSQFRSILLLDNVGKHFYKFLRAQLLDFCYEFLLTTQYGCLPNRGADMAHLH
eukprot:7407111-Karenia_brevis.AAC.1